MSALTPKNGKYRNSWKIFGQQLGNKGMLNKFHDGFDKIKWGDAERFEREDSHLPGYTKIKYKG